MARLLGRGIRVALASLCLACSILPDRATSEPSGAAQSPSLEKTPMQLTSSADALGEATLQVQPARGLFALGFTPRADARPSATEKSERWLPLLQDELAKEPRRDLLVAAGEYPELGARLAAAAARSDRWDAASAKPKVGTTQALAADLLRDPALFSELSALFARLGYTLSVQSIEEVMLCRWDELPAPAHARPARAAPSTAERFPCGASILFRATANAAP